ncbi:MAG: histidine--tRNA ligase [Patescibacteria group bacterium]
MNKKASDKPKKLPQLLRGMKDILPEEQRFWDFIRQRTDQLAQTYGFARIDTPVLEETSLFVRSIGQETDVVEKEMYSFMDKSNDSVSLRPEGTAGVVRAYIEHGMLNRPQPVKMYYIGPFFRYDRPQAGRYRQFHQFGFEVLGDGHPVIDAQLMMLAYSFFNEIGLSVSLQVNSVGCPTCRESYKKALNEYYRSRKNALCEDCKRRLQKNPLRLLDCKVPDCQLLAQDAPQTVDHLCENCHAHFVKVLEHLDGLEIPYVLNSRLVRGLDYYTGTAFEIWPVVEGESPVNPSALCGGGRYDILVKQLGGAPTAAIGFAAGIERLINEIKARDIKVGMPAGPDVFVAQLGDAARKKALRLYEDLRRAGLRVAETFSKDGIKPQMEMANKLAVKYALILGQKEMLDGTILIRDMENGIQETVDFQKVISEIQKRLSKNNVVATNHNHIHMAEQPPKPADEGTAKLSI